MWSRFSRFVLTDRRLDHSRDVNVAVSTSMISFGRCHTGWISLEPRVNTLSSIRCLVVESPIAFGWGRWNVSVTTVADVDVTRFKTSFEMACVGTITVGVTQIASSFCPDAVSITSKRLVQNGAIEQIWPRNVAATGKLH